MVIRNASFRDDEYYEGDSIKNFKSAIKIQTPLDFPVSWQQCYPLFEE
jgi:hypothetical protein